MTEETAKATQEIAKTTSKVADIIEGVGKFVSKVIGPASNEFAGILADWTRFYRYKNLLIIGDKVDAIHKQRKIEGKTIHIQPRMAIPLLESAGLEDDENLQDVWARLIANSTDPNFREILHPGYIEVIKQLSTDEAIMLSAFRRLENYPILFEVSLREAYTNSRLIALLKTQQRPFGDLFDELFKFCENLPLKNPKDLLIYMDNLERLNIVKLQNDLPQRLADGSQMTYGGHIKVTHTESLETTNFGKRFIEACIDNSR